MKQYKISAVPTTIITGFLGAGKTSAILQLLKHKPVKERWAILVNEFGEIGVDGSLLDGQCSKAQGVYIREVAGGCMCCTAGVPMQIALNQLLKEAKPDRLLIEPTGLGHPREVLKVLSAIHYQTVLSLQNTLTLVDARQLNDVRYTSHDTFNQQIAIADIVIGNKVDLYSSENKNHLIDYVKTHGKAKENTADKMQPQVIFAQQGNVPFSVLSSKARLENSRAGNNNASTKSLSDLDHAGNTQNYGHDHPHEHSIDKTLTADLPMPTCGFIKAKNIGEGFTSVGWRFSSNKVFDNQKLYSLLTRTNAERIKAVFITENGSFGYNITCDDITKTAFEKNDKTLTESRIEIIGVNIDEEFEADLLACLVS